MGRFSKIVAAVLVLVALVLGAYAWLLSQKTARAPLANAPIAAPASAQADSGVAVVVAARDLAPNQPLRADDFKIASMTERPVGGFSGVQPLIGQVALSAISAGAPITRSTLAAGIASQLLAGERAMAVAVDELNGVGHRIVPGDHVDVFVSLKPEQSVDGTGYLAQSRLLASSLRVLGYGAASLGDPVAADAEAESADDSRNTSARNGTKPADGSVPARAASSAVLAVPVDQVNTLAQAAQGGRLLLTLRHPGDERVADASLFPKPASVLAVRADLDAAGKAALADPVNLAFAGLDAPNLGGLIAAAKPPRAPTRSPTSTAAPRRTLEVIRGDQRSQTTY